MKRSKASSIHQFVFKNFLKPKENSSLEEMVKWFRDMNVKNPKPVHVAFCKIMPQQLRETRYYYLIPKETTSDKILFYLHGGSYAGGPNVLQWLMIARIAKQVKCKAVVVDYKLTPEYTFPVPLEESLAIYEKIKAEYDGKEIVFIGDSAGGGLALATAFKLRDEGKKLPSKLVLLSPLLDVMLRNKEIDPIEKLDVMLVRKGVQKVSKKYCGQYEEVNPYISPLYGDLTGLPPTFLTIGTHDLFFPDCELFKAKAEKAGVSLTYVKEVGMFHDWVMFPLLPETNKTIKQIRDFISK